MVSSARTRSYTDILYSSGHIFVHDNHTTPNAYADWANPRPNTKYNWNDTTYVDSINGHEAFPPPDTLSYCDISGL